MLPHQRWVPVDRRGCRRLMRTLEWTGESLRILDQRRLPLEEVYISLADEHGVAEAIRTLAVRGAPAIGVAAAYGVALGVRPARHLAQAAFGAILNRVCAELAATRPTAVNLFWAIDRVRRVAEAHSDPAAAADAILTEARSMEREDEEANRRLGAYGAELVPTGARILTHCNAGALATVAYGTALGIIRAAWEQGKRIEVYVGETRPLLQGSRLTAWELAQDGIPVTVITDSMAGQLMRRGRVDLALVGADRVAANGDVANKIGTYSVAVLAREHGLPFYVAAPTSSIDLGVPGGDSIPIEERSPEEVVHFAGLRVAPEGVRVENPAFDVTPHRLVSAIVTERGIVREPYAAELAALLGVAAPEPARGR